MDQILLVEDDTAMAESLVYALEAEQFAVRHARTLDQAEENCQGVDLILLDVSLPDGCGYDFCKRIRQKENCPVVFLTARDDEADIVHGLELGADDYITKPFRPLEMIARVKSQLRRYQKYNPAHSDTGETSSAASEDNLVCGSLTMNIKAHTCFLGETPLVLTPTEFSILRILLENTGNVVSSEDLFHKIWQDEYYSKSNNTITVHIRHLREKMGDSMDLSLIHI